MHDPWSTPPENLESRVSVYVKKASALGLPEALVRKYARILIAAEEVTAHRDRGKQETRDKMAIIAAAEHDCYTVDPEKARAAYAAARKAQQEIHGSATGCAVRLGKLKALLETRHSAVQIDVVAEYTIEKLISAIQLIEAFASATVLRPNLLAFKIAKSELSETIPGHAFMWWRWYVPRYRGQLKDIHNLGRVWRLTDTRDVEVFERLVRKLKPVQDLEGGTYILRCPPWALP
jgi:hypothetical protein